MADNPKTEQNTAEQSANTVSLVIGASGGIGKALVHLLASAEPDVGDNPNKVIALSRTDIFKPFFWTKPLCFIVKYAGSDNH